MNNVFSGGSENFKDKQDFFNHEIRQLHSKRPHDKLSIKISRHMLLESVSSYFKSMPMVLTVLISRMKISHLNDLNTYKTRIDFSLQNLTSTDVESRSPHCKNKHI